MSTKTIWVDAPDIAQRRWLLKDGSVIVTPPIERTATNKRLRVKGTTVSMGIRQLDSLLESAIIDVARTAGSEPWMQLAATPAEERMGALNNAGIHNDLWSEALELHLFKDRDANQARKNRDQNRTSAVWSFKARGLPLTAFVIVEITSNYGGDTRVSSRVVHRTTHPRDNAGGATLWTTYQQQGWQRLAFNVGYHGPESDAVDAFTESDTHPFGPVHDDRPKMENKSFGSQPRRAVSYLLKQCEALNQVSSIELPDFRDGLTPTMLTYDFAETNYSGSFAQELRDFASTGPILDRIREHYAELIADLSMLGIVMPDRPEEKAFQKAVNGDFTELAMGIHPQENADDTDSHHKVFLNLASGTVTVSCTSPHNVGDAIAQWEIDKFRYEATGELSELLAYARGFHEKADRKKAKKIAKDRTFDPDGEP